MRSLIALAVIGTLAAPFTGPALADGPRDAPVRKADAPELEQSVAEPRRFPLRLERDATDRTDRTRPAPMPPVISGPFGAM